MENQTIEIRKLADQYKHNNLSWADMCKGIDECIKELLSQHSANVLVSGNEANQPENKKDGEVALPQFILIIEEGDIVIKKDGKHIITFVDCDDWMYGTPRLQELFEAMGITNVNCGNDR